MKNIKIYTLCIGLLLVLVSCGKNISEREKESFDTDLVFANHTYMSTWGYESAMRLNIEYLKKAEKMNYPEGKGICYHNIACINVTIGIMKKPIFFSIRRGNILTFLKIHFIKLYFIIIIVGITNFLI